MIELVSYDSMWPARFAAEAVRLRRVCGPGALRIDHVGSTSIPGLAAKPIIDVQIVGDALTPLVGWADRLAVLGYRHHPSPDDIEYPFFHRPVGWPHTYAHLCLSESAMGRATLALRDYLREHPAERDAYAIEKRRLASLHVGDTAERREAYARANRRFSSADHTRASARLLSGSGFFRPFQR